MTMLQIYKEIAWHHKMMLLILLFNLIDFLTTKRIIEQFGFHMEYNVWLRNLLIYTNSIWSILLVKIGIIIFSWLLIQRFYIPSKHKIVPITLGIVLIGMIGISIHNFIGLYHLWMLSL